MRRGTSVREVPEEGLMLTGDENIVNVDFSVLWNVKPDGVDDRVMKLGREMRCGPVLERR